MSSRRRLYLNLKQSITKLFKTPAHYLKEITGKQSLFEKPYLDRDYRQMHLNLPVSTWKRPEFDPGGIWPLPRKHTFVFDDGICSLFGQSGECGETIWLSGWVGLVPLGSLGREITWQAQSSDSEGARIEGIELSLGGTSALIQVKFGDDFTGTVIICARASMAGGSTLKEIAYLVPSQIGGVPTVPGWTPSLEYAMRNLPPIYEIREESGEWDCGCVELEIVCVCTGVVWDDGASADTVAQGSSCTVAVTGGTGNMTWSVSGSGFWFDAGYTKTVLIGGNSVTLYADGAACGTATISVCGITGHVRSTTGVWGNRVTYGSVCAAENAHGCALGAAGIIGKHRIANIQWCYHTEGNCQPCQENCPDNCSVGPGEVADFCPTCDDKPVVNQCLVNYKDVDEWIC